MKTSQKNEKTAEIANLSEVSERLSILVSGEEYIKFKVLSERIVFEQKLGKAEKKRAILEMALELLSDRVEEFVLSGKSFMTPNDIFSYRIAPEAAPAPEEESEGDAP